jgi:hypothetical protein
MTFNVLVGIAAVLWLLSVVACVLALRWSSIPRRFWAAIILSGVALIIGYLGITRFHVVASETVNGQLRWRFDSKWFFIATLVLGAITLGYTLWKRAGSATVA